MPSVFLLGITGYVGGSYLLDLLESIPDLRITALIRHEKDVAPVERLGVKAILGNYTDFARITQLASDAQIVYNFASCDDEALTRAVLDGAKARFERDTSATKPILIHTSGTGLLIDGVDGSFIEGSKVYNDANEDDVKYISPEAMHRSVDLAIFAANAEGYVDAFIVAPPTINGTGSGPVNRISVQIPYLIRHIISRKQAFFFGEGTNRWNAVHIKDLSDLYVCLTKHALSGTDKNGSFGRFYFAASEEFVWSDVSRAIAPLLVKKGVLPSAEVISVPASDIPLSIATASNSRSRSDRAAALGWKPKAPGLLETLPQDVDAILALTGVTEVQ